METDCKQIDINENPTFYRGWFIVLGAFFTLSLTSGTGYSFGVFFVPLLEQFNWTRGSLSIAMLIMGISSAVATPLSGWLADRFGFRSIMAIFSGLFGLGFLLSAGIQTLWQFYLFQGLCIGCAAGMFYALPASIVSCWFIKRQGLALGIATCGVGIGTIIGPPLITYIIYNYGWRLAFGLCGMLICLVCIPTSWFMMRKPESDYLMAHEGRNGADLNNSPASEGQPGLSLREALSSRMFWLLYVVYMICMLSLSIVMVHLVPDALDKKLPAMTAAGLLTVIGGCSIIGRLISGALADRIGTKPVLVACLVVQAGIIWWLIQAFNPWMFYVFAILFGISYGGFVPLLPKLTSDMFGSASMGAIFGALMTSDAIGWGVGPWATGYLFDLTGSYDIPFQSLMAAIMLAGIVTLFLKKPSHASYTNS
jgi:MFS family permease